MKNNDLDDILKEKFISLQDADLNPSMVPEVMQRIVALAPPEPLEIPQERVIKGDWLVAVAATIGAFVLANSLQVLPIEALSEMLPLELLGRYAQSASALILPLAGFVTLMPVAWMMLED